MAARDRLGGLAAITTAAVVLMRAVFDRVIVETVGVGQSETDIASVADSVLLCVQPGSGDSLQYMKAGIAEIPDIAIVTKADLGAVARQTRRDLQSALAATGGVGGRTGWTIPALALAAGEEGAADELIHAIDRHRLHIEAGPIDERRRRQAESWLEGAIREVYGRQGLKTAETMPGGWRLGPGQSPFRRIQIVRKNLADRFS